MLPRILKFAGVGAVLCSAALAQSSAPVQSPATAGQPQVKVNYLNVCAPEAADRELLAATLAKISTKPAFAIDMEVSRGRSTVTASDLPLKTGAAATSDAPQVSRWVRIRRDMPEKSAILNAQYSFSVSEAHVTETLVFHFRDAKDVLQVAISDSVEAPAEGAAQVAKLATPADRVRIERFGKSSVVAARCPTADQSALEPLFRSATDILNSYRRALGIASSVPGELARLGTVGSAKPEKSSAKAH